MCAANPDDTNTILVYDLNYDAIVWGPHYWFFIYTLAISYPKKANSVLKKKYYDFIQNLPIFIPIADIGNSFSRLLYKYPVIVLICIALARVVGWHR